LRFAFRFSWFWLGRKYINSKNLKHRRILIIGPSSSIGLELIKDLSSRQADLLVVSSDRQVNEEILQNSFFESTIQIEVVDFTRLQSVQELCESLLRKGQVIDILINSAEIINHPPQLTEDQIEVTFQTNYLSQFLATVKLLPLLKKSRDCRIINITSGSHRSVERSPKKEFHQLYRDSPDNRKYAYEYSKYCLTSFAWKLSNLLSSSSANVSVHCVDPGSYSKNPLHLLISKTPNEAIQGILYAILSDRKPSFYIEGIEGSQNFSHLVSNQLLADILWKISRKLIETNLMSASI